MSTAVFPQPFTSGQRLIDGLGLDRAFAYPLLSTQDAITATASGTQSTAFQLSAYINRVSVVATAADSVKLPSSETGRAITVINDAANALQIFGKTVATINGVAAATGISQPGNSVVTYYAPVAGKWFTEGGVESGGAFTTLTATTINGNTFTTGTGTLTLAAGKTLTASNTLTLAGTDSTTMTFPSTTDTVAGLAAAQTLTNKTINGAIYSTDNAVASATLTRNSSTVLTNVAGMVVTVVPGTYKFEVLAPCVSTANTGISVAFKLTTTVITSCAVVGTGFSAAASNQAAYSTTTADQTLYYDTAAGVELSILLKGTMVIGTGGTIQFQMAQHTSHADSTSIFAGAYMTFTRIA